nr:60S ribosomal protein L18a-2 [Ipomoea trifida]
MGKTANRQHHSTIPPFIHLQPTPARRRREEARPPIPTATTGGRQLLCGKTSTRRAGDWRAAKFRQQFRVAGSFGAATSGGSRDCSSWFLPSATAAKNGSSGSPFFPATAADNLDVNGGVNVDNLDVNGDGEQNDNVDVGDEKDDDEKECENNDNQDQFQRKKRKRVSKAHADFSEVASKDGSIKLQCVDIIDGVMKSTKDWGIEHKIFTISVDNASNNDVAVRIAKETFSRSHKLPLGVDFAFNQIYNANDARINVMKVRDALHDLFYEYVEMDNMKTRKGSSSMQNVESLSITSSCSTSKGKVVLSDLSLYDKYLDTVEDVTPNKSELDIYLEEGVYRCQDGEVTSEFDVLAWWKSHELKFSILSKLARDVLAIPISTVASETTFNEGTRVLDPYRAKLSSDMVQVLFHQYQVVGRALPSESDEHPKIYRMKLWATNEVRAKSKFWYFLRKLKKVKKANGQVLAINEIFEKNPTTIKNFGIWLRYQSRTGYHNMYKEYRDTTLNGAVEQMYNEMASRHRVRHHCIQIIKTATVPAKLCKRESTKQFHNSKIKFPLVFKKVRPPSRKLKTTYKASKPNLFV